MPAIPLHNPGTWRWIVDNGIWIVVTGGMFIAIMVFVELGELVKGRVRRRRR